MELLVFVIIKTEKIWWTGRDLNPRLGAPRPHLVSVTPRCQRGALPV